MSELPHLEERVAGDVFRTEVRRWAEQIGVEPKEIDFRPAKRKWASALSAGRLTFDSVPHRATSAAGRGYRP